MKLYITPGSPYARIARVVVLEKGLESRVEIIAAQTRLADSPYYSVNPSGRVPYLIRDDGVGLEESANICAYLDHLDRNPVFDLLAGDQAWEARRPKPWREACWTDSQFGAARSRDLKTSVCPQSSSTKQTAVDEWLISGR